MSSREIKDSSKPQSGSVVRRSNERERETVSNFGKSLHGEKHL